MGRPRVGRRRDQRSWLENVPRRVMLTRSAADAYPDFHYRRHQLPAGVSYYFSATVPIEGYEDRRVLIRFDSMDPHHPVVLVDGPDDSPHRFPTRGGRHELCLWYPLDPPERRWVPEDGLITLFGMITIHLFKEAWQRENGEWIGEEYPHNQDQDKPSGQAA